MQFAGTAAGNQREEKSENKEAGRGARCARLKAPEPASPTSVPRRTPVTTQSPEFILFFSLSRGSPPFSALPSLPPPCFSSPPRGSLRDVCVCPNVWVFTSGIKGVKSRESIKEYKGTRAPDETRPVPQISCSPPSFNFGDILFILFFSFFPVFGLERVQLGRI